MAWYSVKKAEEQLGLLPFYITIIFFSNLASVKIIRRWHGAVQDSEGLGIGDINTNA
jgi:hypothetical protein